MIYLDLYLSFFKIGLFTFGGGYAMIPMLEKELIEKKAWATNEQMANYYAISQCTPGVIAVNVATFVGCQIKGIFGGIIATLGVISPSIVIISLIASFLTNFNDIEIIKYGIEGANVSIAILLILSVYKLFKQNVKSIFTFTIFISGFIAAYFFKVSTMILVIIYCLIGIIISFRKAKNV